MSLKLKIYFLFFISILFNACVRIDESMKLFFPKELSELQYVQTEFSAFWWNFIIVEPYSPNTADFETAEKLCLNLKQNVGKELRMIFCGSQDATNQSILKQWARDFAIRQEFNPEFSKKNIQFLQSTLTQAGFVSDQKMLQLLQFDPYQTWNQFLELSNNSFLKGYSRKNGFLIDESTQRIILPLEFQLSPQFKNIEPIQKKVDQFSHAKMIGSHASTYQNQNQVQKDLTIVSWVSSIVFICFILFLIKKSRINTVFLIVPVGAALLLATWLTQLIEGSVHGLTLAFGSGIVGLALDYGLHGAFGSESKQTWKSNAIGLITTLSGIGILILSGIPLIRQMMIFSISGLLIGFLLFYFLFKFYSPYLKIKHIDFMLPQFRYSKLMLGLFFIFGLVGLSQTKLSMNLQNLSFSSQIEKDYLKWFYSKNNSEPIMLIQPFRGENAESYFKQYEWAQAHHVEYDGISKYFPSFASQKMNLISWQKQACPKVSSLESNLRIFFKSYFETVCDTQSDQFDFAALKGKSYLNHLIGEDHVLSIFYAKNAQETEMVLRQFPESKSLVQAVKNFSISLEKDLQWMIPLTLILTLLILSIYYKKALYVFTSILPFLTGLGFYFTASLIFSFDIDLVSLLGLVMVFGFSVDYGVFSTDVHVFSGDKQIEVKSVYSALSFAALTNILGFFPMLFAGHPVLLKLGAALFFGTIGTYLGTIYGVYPIFQKRKSIVYV